MFILLAMNGEAKHKKFRHFESVNDIIDIINLLIRQGDFVFIKGSNGNNLSRLIRNSKSQVMKYLETGFHQLLNSLNDLKEIDQWILFISIGYFHQRALVVNSFSDTFAQSLGDVLMGYKEVTSQIRDPVAFHKIDIVVSEKTISATIFQTFGSV